VVLGVALVATEAQATWPQAVVLQQAQPVYAQQFVQPVYAQPFVQQQIVQQYAVPVQQQVVLRQYAPVQRVVVQRQRVARVRVGYAPAIRIGW
jgi:hypothetical protein